MLKRQFAERSVKWRWQVFRIQSHFRISTNSFLFFLKLFSDVLHRVGQNFPFKKSALLLMHQFSIPGSLVARVAIIQVQRRADVAVTALLQRLQDGKTHWYSFSDVPMIYTQEIAVFLQEGVNFFKQNLLTQLMSEGVLCYLEQLWHHMKYPLILQPMKADVISYGKSRGNPKRSPSPAMRSIYTRPKLTVDATKCLPYGWLII